MNQHSPVTRKTAPKTRTQARAAARKTAAAARPKLDRLTSTAKRVASRVGAKAAEVGAQSIRQEQPETLAKMAVAALVPTLAPRVAAAALRFVIRNPIVAMAGIAVAGAIIVLDDKRETART